ncbi:Uncharacterized protein FWK35_00031130, partial [Aphis craccivora]
LLDIKDFIGRQLAVLIVYYGLVPHTSSATEIAHFPPLPPGPAQVKYYLNSERLNIVQSLPDKLRRRRRRDNGKPDVSSSPGGKIRFYLVHYFCLSRPCLPHILFFVAISVFHFPPVTIGDFHFSARHYSAGQKKVTFQRFNRGRKPNFRCRRDKKSMRICDRCVRKLYDPSYCCKKKVTPRPPHLLAAAYEPGACSFCSASS